LLAGQSAAAAGELNECERCGSPTTGDICAFCRLVETSSAHEPVPVELVVARGGRRRRR
jgi:tRNA-5-methyluridine54 2-sulfurtransferase